MKKFLLLLTLGFFFYTSNATVFSVNSTSDASTGSGTSGTLRWCITQANTTTVKDTINFAVSGTFTVGSNYPTITYPLYINGYSAPSTVQAALGTGTRAIKVVLNGPGTNTVYGFQITCNNCVIAGLVIQDFFKGIYINGGDNNWIWGNYIGTAADGLSASAATTCYDDGIAINANANNNIIGTNGDGSNDANEGNLISGNGDGGAAFLGEGVAINEGGAIGTDCSGNRIAGNYLGTNETGTAALYTNPTAGAQRGSGVQINYSTANIIGTNGDGISDALERNIISGNSDCGIVLAGGSGNKIKGNYIGTTKTGLVGLPNYADGGVNIAACQITIKSASNNNYIGTDGDGTNDNVEGNVIGSATISAGSAGFSYNYGFYISASTGNKISGNYIGIGANGTTALNMQTTSGPYVDKCIYVSGGSTSTIVGTNGDGTSDTYETNYFGNTGYGVTIDNSNTCVIAGNYFGLGTNLTTAETFTTTAGTASAACIYILNSTSCRVGSSASNNLERNYLCNATVGVYIDGNSTSHADLNNIRYNTIGLRPDGVGAGNGYAGIGIYKESNSDTIQYNILAKNCGITPSGLFGAISLGYTPAGDDIQNTVIKGNTIYKNIGPGIQIQNTSSIRNLITQNSIYNNGNASDATGKFRLGIDLNGDNVTANDNLDPDTGPNDFSNFPIIGSASPSGSCSQTVSGTFNGLASTQYYVEVYSGDVCNGDSAGVDHYSDAGYNYGEGKTYLATSSVFTTNASGNGTWTVTLPLAILADQYITATAIQNSGTDKYNTSEFSLCYLINFDCGDAPDIYHTLLSNCGAVHVSAGNTLKIGSTVTFDNDGMPGVLANGDVDDGITAALPAITVKTTSYSLSSIPVTNTTGSTATLYAWIDFDGDGSFEASEFTSASVANGATSATLTWNLSSATCGTSLVVGTTYLRMRLTTTSLTDDALTTTTDERSYGEAANGEVEDYKLYISGYDYGDFPNTYPVATALCLEDTAAAKVWAGVTKPSRECTQHYSVDAYGDGAEEDGLTTNIGPSGTTNNWVVKLNSNTVSKTVYYGLWLDWDGNKVFNSGIDAFYSGSATVNGVTNKSVAVTTPYGLVNSGFRLMISDAAVTSGMYNATIANGEVEDYLLSRILTVPGNILMGSKQLSANILKWKNSISSPLAGYTIERSNDNVSWMTVGSVIPASSDNSLAQYSFSDTHPLADNNYYRLRLDFSDGTFQYSNIVLLADKSASASVFIYPNPASNIVHVQTSNSNIYRLQVQDLTGRVELNQSVSSYNTDVDISNLSAGTHIIKLITKAGEEEVQKFVKTK